MASKHNKPIFVNSHPLHKSDELKLTDADFVYVHDMVKEVTELRALPSLAFCSLISLAIISLLLGSYFKSIIYRGILTVKFKARPINILILLQAVVQHFTHIFFGANVILSICFDQPSDIFFNETYCNVVLSVATFGIGYVTIAGFATAAFRLIYIRYNHWAKYVAGERRILVVLSLGGFILSFIIGYFYLIEVSANRQVYNECIAQSGVALSYMMEFKKSQGKYTFNTTITAI